MASFPLELEGIGVGAAESARVIGAWNGGHAATGGGGAAGKGSSTLRRLARSGRSAFDTTGPCRARGGDGGVLLPPTTCKVSDDTQAGRPASGDTPLTNDSSESSERARLRSISTGARAAGRSATPSNNLAAAVNNASCGRASKFGTAAARARLTSSSDDTFLAGGGCAALRNFLKYFCAWDRT